jgi:hypothetical protein
LKNG